MKAGESSATTGGNTYRVRVSMAHTLPPTLTVMTGLIAVEIPAGEAGIAALWDRMPAALAGEECLALVPIEAPPAVRACFHLDAPVDDLEGIACLVATSGSTGNPRAVRCQPSALLAHPDATVHQWVLALPPSAMGGLKVIIRGITSGLRPIGIDGALTAALPRIARAEHSAPLAISLVPTQLAQCLRDPAATSALAAFDHVLIGGAHLPEVIATRARDASIPIAVSYGATETCGGCVIDGTPLAEVTVTIEADGRIRLRGPMVTRGYRGDPLATQAVFDGESFLTNDIGTFDEQGRLQVIGRSDDIVTITGVNVSTNAVAERLLAHPNVTQAAVVVVQRSTHTPELAAFLVGSPTGLENWVRDALGVAAVPRTVRWVDALPELATGKVDRLRLVREWHGDTG